jgi:phosphatidylserine/phosphatidylglycerophosphate/cardiolipin synthase-like enzyme
MTTTTTIQEGAQILINEYKEVSDALLEIKINLDDMGKTRSILSDILETRSDELFRNIKTYVPHMTLDEVLDWIADNAQ